MSLSISSFSAVWMLTIALNTDRRSSWTMMHYPCPRPDRFYWPLGLGLFSLRRHSRYWPAPPHLLSRCRSRLYRRTPRHALRAHRRLQILPMHSVLIVSLNCSCAQIRNCQTVSGCNRPAVFDFLFLQRFYFHCWSIYDQFNERHYANA